MHTYKFVHLRVLGAFAEFRKATISCVISFCLSDRPSPRNNSAPTGRIVVKFDIVIYSKIRRENPISVKIRQE